MILVFLESLLCHFMCYFGFGDVWLNFELVFYVFNGDKKFVFGEVSGVEVGSE